MPGLGGISVYELQRNILALKNVLCLLLNSYIELGFLPDELGIAVAKRLHKMALLNRLTTTCRF